MILDSHIHLWDDAIAAADWLRGPSSAEIRRPFTLDQYTEGIANLGVRAAIVVTAEQSVAETSRLIDECDGSDLIAGIVGWVDLTGAIEQPLDRLLGIRHSVISEDARWLDRSDVRRGLTEFARAGLVFEVLAAARDLPSIIRCADSYPTLTIVVDHLGSPPERPDEWAAWRASIEMIALRENVRFKMSGTILDAATVDVVLTGLGPERLMFGSNWPVSLLVASLDEELGALRAATVSLSPSESDQLMAGTAIESYGLAV
ncbi:MAG TPA: amidohydrolase family protein [Galbitalea sp.]|nr:amidohydrolase family protein [Galbitalea sp.]